VTFAAVTLHRWTVPTTEPTATPLPPPPPTFLQSELIAIELAHRSRLRSLLNRRGSTYA